MSLRSSGWWCDICNQPMLTELFMKSRKIIPFKLSCSPTSLDGHEACIPQLNAAVDAEDETLLPMGPVRDLLRRVKEHNAKLESP